MSLRTLERWFILGIVPVVVFATLAFVIIVLVMATGMSIQEAIISLSKILAAMVVAFGVTVGIGMIIDAMLGYNNQ